MLEKQRHRVGMGTLVAIPHGVGTNTARRAPLLRLMLRLNGLAFQTPPSSRASLRMPQRVRTLLRRRPFLVMTRLLSRRSACNMPTPSRRLVCRPALQPSGILQRRMLHPRFPSPRWRSASWFSAILHRCQGQPGPEFAVLATTRTPLTNNIVTPFLTRALR